MSRRSYIKRAKIRRSHKLAAAAFAARFWRWFWSRPPELDADGNPTVIGVVGVSSGGPSPENQASLDALPPTDLKGISPMNTELSRRSFLQGIGASIVLAALPVIGISQASARTMPLIALKNPHGRFTAKFFSECLQDIFAQVRAMDHLRPNRQERAAIAKNIDHVLWEVRPIGVLIEMKIPYEKMIAGNFSLHEPRPGVVEVF